MSGLSAPRGFGKTWLYAQLFACAIRPGGPLYEEGVEVLYMSSSLEQSRIMVTFLRAALEDVEDDYSWVDSSQRLLVTHKATATRLRVLSSSGKRALGLGAGQSLIALDEPASFNVNESYMVWDALQGSLGKRPLKILVIGCRAPAPENHWWPELLAAGSSKDRYIQLHSAGQSDDWDSYQTALRSNPVLRINPLLRKTVLSQRDDARVDSRLEAYYKSYRLNLPTADASTMLLTVKDWLGVESRAVPPREGAPVIAFDLGAGRAWSAAVAHYSNGRIEALALTPGKPSIEDQERRDRVPRFAYQKLVDNGLLLVDEDLQVQGVKPLVDAALEAWGRPSTFISDRARIGELEDAVGRIPLIKRVTMWFEASEDIRALRRYAKDGPLACPREYRALFRTSLSAAMVRNDDSGNTRLSKRSTDNVARDDIAAALVLGCGEVERRSRRRRRPRRLSLGLVG